LLSLRDDIRPRIQAVDLIDVDVVPSIELGFGLGVDAGQRETQQE
jgi:hypothetical protein